MPRPPDHVVILYSSPFRPLVPCPLLLQCSAANAAYMRCSAVPRPRMGRKGLATLRRHPTMVRQVRSGGEGTSC
eukprot:7623077-Pyramimonas_sp.AAC.1